MTRPYVNQIGIHLGGVGFSYQEKRLVKTKHIWQEQASRFSRQDLHIDVDEKEMFVDGSSYQDSQHILSKDVLLNAWHAGQIKQELQALGLSNVLLANTESGMSQCPLLADVLIAGCYYELESLLREHIRQSLGGIESLREPLRNKGFRLHRRIMLVVVAGSGGGTGPAAFLRSGQILRKMKLSGELPNCTIIGALPLATAYEIDIDKKQRAMAINAALLNDLSFQMSGRDYSTCLFKANKLQWLRGNGSFDFIFLFGSGQDYSQLSYHQVLTQMVECFWLLSYGCGVEFLSMITNEISHLTNRINEETGNEYRQDAWLRREPGNGHDKAAFSEKVDHSAAGQTSGSRISR
jgi:hypothetical protein